MRSKRAEWRRDTAESSRVVRDCPRAAEMPRPVATRPLWMQRVSGSYNFFYFHDGNKNVSDLVSYQSARGVPAHYEYAPCGVSRERRKLFFEGLVRHRRTMLNQWRSKYKEILANPQGESFMI